MNLAETSVIKSGPHRLPTWVVFLVPTVMGLFAITGRSFWIDECVTAEYVCQPTFSEWRADLLTTEDAEAHTPFYLLYVWEWVKLFGHGEWSLRAAGLPLFVVGAGLFLWSLRWVGKRGWIALSVLAGNAFIWYYLNEARLYSMQFGVACAVSASLIALGREESSSESGRRWWFRIFLVSSLLLSAISIIGMLWAGAATLILWLVIQTKNLWARIRSAPIICLIWVIAHSWLAGYYISSTLRGARASGLATTNLETFVYAGYELLGFTGLGPGRDALRQEGIQALTAYGFMLGLFSVLTLIVLIAGLLSIWKSPWRTRAAWIAGAISLPSLFLLLIGVIRHFRVLGRHLTPFLVVIMFLLVLGVAWLWGRGKYGRVVVIAYLLLSFVSAMQVRFVARHQKDDYRMAARYARQALADGKRVWWAAAIQGADYYSLPITQDPMLVGKAYVLFGQTFAELAESGPVDLVLLSRPDIYDYRGGLAQFLATNEFRVQTNYHGFSVWQRQR